MVMTEVETTGAVPIPQAPGVPEFPTEPPTDSLPVQRRGPQYASAAWEALGTYVSLVVADGSRLEQAVEACELLLDRVDRACSRFREDSDLVMATEGSGRWVSVDPLLCQALSAAVRVAEATGGLVDPTIGHSLVALGYDRDISLVRELAAGGRAPDRGPASIAVPVIPDAWRSIQIDLDGAVLVPPGVSLDLGSTGKAFAADLIAAGIPEAVGTSLIISLGGDVAVGQLADEEHPWLVSVAERPQDAGGPGSETVVLQAGGLATSSTLARRWRHGGAPVHHLLDPRTGRPVDAIWRTVSVCAASCLDANAASTAAIVMGELAPAWLYERDLATRLVTADGQVLRVAGWPDADQ
jgi:thiamine biosynthesis lipoprotein